jgi:hypothetical protein
MRLLCALLVLGGRKLGLISANPNFYRLPMMGFAGMGIDAWPSSRCEKKRHLLCRDSCCTCECHGAAK